MSDIKMFTEEEETTRTLSNMFDHKGKSCKGCHWSGYEKGDEFITCGHHIENFTQSSFCSYWTDPCDPRIKEYHTKRMEEINLKYKS